MGSNFEQQLLLGLWAIDQRWIDRDQFLAGFRAWSEQPDGQLIEQLESLGMLQPTQRQELERRLDEYLNSTQSLAADAGQSTLVFASTPRVMQVPFPPGLAATEAHQLAEASLFSCDQPLQQVRSASHSPATKSESRSRYTVLETLAEGGLGRVSIAQDEDLQRQVAFKQILPDKAGYPQLRLRFLREAEITGRLQHPSIVPIYSLGTFANGEPFYTMRMIEGESLAAAIGQYHATVKAMKRRHAGELNLLLRRLLQNFVAICAAMEYAHQRGILHRDLKPSNVMLGKHNETLVVDWGLAKDLNDQAHDPAAEEAPASSAATNLDAVGLTGQGELLGTLVYMSPEQARGENDTLRPASDIYSLGGILYAILTNRHPYQGKPSEVLAAVKAGSVTSPRQWNPSIPKPLEAICLKAMAALPEERYASAQLLAKDVEAYLADEPIQARRDSWGQRFGRVVRRHRGAVLASGVALIMITIGSIAAAVVINAAKDNETLALQRETTAKDQAVTAKDEAVEAKNNAEQQKQNAEQAKKAAEIARDDAVKAQEEAKVRLKESQMTQNFFAYNILAAARPEGMNGGKGKDIKLVDAVIAAIPEIHKRFGDRPLLEAQVTEVIGVSLIYLGRFQQAGQLLEATLKIYRTVYKASDPNLIRVIDNLSTVYLTIEKHKDALLLIDELLENVSANHSSEMLFALENSRASALGKLNRVDEALRIYKKLEDQCRSSKNQASRLKTILNNIAGIYIELEQYEKAVPLLEESVEIAAKTIGLSAPESLESQLSLALSYHLTRQYEKALPVHRNVVAITDKLYGNQHLLTLRAKFNLACTLTNLRRGEEALPLHLLCWENKKSMIELTNPMAVTMVHNIIASYQYADKYDEAISFVESELLNFEKLLGSKHANVQGMKQVLEKAKSDHKTWNHRFDYRELQRDPTVAPIEWTKAEEHAGKLIKVEALVTRAMSSSDGRSLVLHFGKKINGVFCVLIPDRLLDPKSVDAEKKYANRRIRVTGEVYVHQEAKTPLIQLMYLDQIEILDAPAVEEAKGPGNANTAEDTAWRMAQRDPKSAAIIWNAAADHVGKLIKVEGTVTQTFRSLSGEYAVLNFGKEKIGEFCISLPVHLLDKTTKNPEEKYVGRRIRVTGTVEFYEPTKTPNIKPEALGQIEILDDPVVVEAK